LKPKTGGGEINISPPFFFAALEVIVTAPEIVRGSSLRSPIRDVTSRDSY
jgi:hypothetical protein